MPLQHLAYISTAAPTVCEDDIRLILEQSRRNNPARRVTGHLQCHGGCFFQVLEGPAESLDELLAKLLADPRHGELKVLYREPLARRHFADWSMGSWVLQFIPKNPVFSPVPPASTRVPVAIFKNTCGGTWYYLDAYVDAV